MLYLSILETSAAFILNIENALFDGKKEKESIIHVRMGQKNPSLE